MRPSSTVAVRPAPSGSASARRHAGIAGGQRGAGADARAPGRIAGRERGARAGERRGAAGDRRPRGGRGPRAGRAAPARRRPPPASGRGGSSRGSPTRPRRRPTRVTSFAPTGEAMPLTKKNQSEGPSGSLVWPSIPSTKPPAYAVVTSVVPRRARMTDWPGVDAGGQQLVGAVAGRGHERGRGRGGGGRVLGALLAARDQGEQEREHRHHGQDRPASSHQLLHSPKAVSVLGRRQVSWLPFAAALRLPRVAPSGWLLAQPRRSR